MNTVPSSQIPQHIMTLVAKLERWVKAATRDGVSDEEAEQGSLSEQTVSRQLQALGWDADLSTETGHWVPLPAGYSIVSNPLDPSFSPQRCYHIPEAPSQWRFIWDEGRQVSFTRWSEAYCYVFSHLAQEQRQQPLKRYRVRPPATWGGTDYVASSAEQALQMQRNTWLANNWVTGEKAVDLPLLVFEHCGDHDFSCTACQHAPCTYTPAEQWPLVAQPE